MAAAPMLAIIAGGGSAPKKLVESCKNQGRPFVVVCLEGQTDRDFSVDVPCLWMALGSAHRFVRFVHEHNVKEVVMLGNVRRPSLFDVKPDFLALKFLLKVAFHGLGDDGLLKALGRLIEEKTGARLIGAHEIAGDMLMPVGLMTKAKPDDGALRDIRRGFDVARILGAADVGQAAVVQQGIVLGVEAIEGTDALLARCGALARNGAGGVLVKCAKPQQDDRYDLPTIGVNTIKNAVAAGLRGIAIEAGRSLLIDRDEAIACADKAGLFLVGWEDRHE